MQGNRILRKNWVDALRALAMFLVIYGHHERDWIPYFVWTSPVKISLFFAVSGYVFHEERHDYGVFWKKMIRSTVIPWIVIAFFPYILMSSFKGMGFFVTNAADIVTGRILWYMPCFIIAEILWYHTNLFFRSIPRVALASVLLMAAGLLMARFDVLNVFMINRAFVVQIYLLIGYLYKRVISESVRDRRKPLIIAACIVIYFLLAFITLACYPGQSMDIHNNEYYHLGICMIMIWCGVIALLIGAEYYLHRVPGWIIRIGQNTLVIYLWNSFVDRCFVRIFGFSGITVFQGKVFNAVLSMVICIVCSIMAVVLRRLIPGLFGDR